MRSLVAGRLMVLSLVGPLVGGCFAPPSPADADTSGSTASGETASSGGSTTRVTTSDTGSTSSGAATPTTTGVEATGPSVVSETAGTTTGGDAVTGSSATGEPASSGESGTTLPGGATCGDGVVEGDEQCDDGNAIDEDACTSACELAACGDGIVQPGAGETCDDGNQEDTDACPGCKVAQCGDGFVHAGVEACDDGNANNLDACLANCAANPCGNKVFDGDEQCDDGNYVDLDGCSALCTRDAAFVFVSQGTFFGAADGDAFAHAEGLCGEEAVELDSKLDGVHQMGAFLPWMSKNGSMPSTAFVKSERPYVRPDGLPVAMNWVDLTTPQTPLMNPIQVTSSKALLPAGGDDCGPSVVAWTGTTVIGSLAASFCNNWSTANGFSGTLGSARRTDSAWTSCGTNLCTSMARVYCFEQLE
ncbi:MAG: DUF4215 domain-containing protein [Myxococcales bacterium]|nr:DUF4215 domain-containing protein [Myxococcales bacterium]